MGLIKYYRFSLWCIIIALLCFTPGNEFKEVKINIPHFDKVIHFVMFFILGLFLKGIEDLSQRKLYIFIFTCIIYAGLIEIIQHFFIAMRGGDILDFLSDMLGLLLGLMNFKYMPRFVKRLLQ